MTNKINAVAKEIERIIHEVFPNEYLSIVFDNCNITISDVVNQLLVECCKFAYDTKTEKHSLLYYIQHYSESPDDEEALRLRLQRTLDYIYLKRDLLDNFCKENGIKIEGLRRSNMDSMKEKLLGYQFTPFQFWELNDVHDNKLVKAILEHRIAKKNTTIDQVINYAKEYDKIICEAIENIDNNIDVVINFLKVFILESKYSFNFYYTISKDLSDNKISVDDDFYLSLERFSKNTPLCSVCHDIGYRELTDYYPIAENRLLNTRNNLSHFIVTKSTDDIKPLVIRFNEARYIVENLMIHMTYQNMPIQKWFTENTCEEDWISVFKAYGIEKIICKTKDWDNPKTIRYIKKLYSIF